MQKLKLKLVSIVWGREYIDNLADVCLWSMLSPKNISVIAENKTSFDIYTRKGDIALIKDKSIFKVFDALAEVKFIPIDKHLDRETYSIQTTCLKDAIKSAIRHKQIIKIISPDVYMSDGAMQTIDHIRDGKKAVVMPTGALRVYPNFKSEVVHRNGVPSSDLVRLFKEYMHRETKDHFVDSETFFPNPKQIIVNNKEYLNVNSFYYQPYFFKPDVNAEWWNVELDMMTALFPNEQDIHIINDSREAFEVSVTKPDYERNQWGKNRFDPVVFSDMVEAEVSGHNVKCFENGYKIYEN